MDGETQELQKYNTALKKQVVAFTEYEPILKKLKSTPNNSILLGNTFAVEEMHGRENHDGGQWLPMLGEKSGVSPNTAVMLYALSWVVGTWLAISFLTYTYNTTQVLFHYLDLQAHDKTLCQTGLYPPFQVPY